MTVRVQQTQALDTDVALVRYAHGKRLEGLHELGIFTIRDLLEHYPFRYDDFSRVVKIVDLPLGEKNAALGTIHEINSRRTLKGGYLYEIAVTDGTGLLKAIWFNQKWLAETLTKGKTILLLGKVEHQGGYPRMSSPLYTLVSNEHRGATAAEQTAERGNEQAGEQTAKQANNQDSQISGVDYGPSPVGISPVYRANSKVSSNWIKRLILESRELAQEPLDPLPPKLRIKRRLMSRQIAWQCIHSPSSQEELTLSHYRLAYEQVFFAQLRFAVNELREQQGLVSFTHSTQGKKIKELTQLLPFTLTASQQRAVDELFADMSTPKRMNRLLLGDVGSGKTVVALHALVAAQQNGWQAVMMAPTEILAQQYANSLGPLLDALEISWVLLTSSLTAKEKQEAYAGIASGRLAVAFGTHALIEPEVQFKKLSLIVVDEQHRFGVEHRNKLIAKSPAADFLSMTATPIPRSLALVLYGNVQVSYLENRPGKATTHTVFLNSSVVYKAYEGIRAALSRGEQAYIVCPFISAPPVSADDEESYLDDLDDFFDEPAIAAAESELEHLRRQVFPERHIELLTSRVKSEEKQKIMAAFKAGDIDVLVSTTVIEVGIDVPNATVMVILDANRFGLAQLHQLRGRVGRGTQDAQVFLVANRPSESARKRLGTLERYNDGLILAEADLLERHEGDIGGTRQHGSSALSLINVIRDSALIEAAHQDVTRLLEGDPGLALPEHQHLRAEILLVTDDPKN